MSRRPDRQGAVRVLVAHPSADLYGSDLVLLETVTALVESGATVTATVPADGPLVSELERRGADVALSIAPVLRRSILRPRGALRFGLDTLRGVAACTRLMRRVRPDLVYVNTVTIPLWLALGRLLRIPTVCHVHEAEAESPRPVRLALASPLLLADAIVSNSEHCIAVVSDAFPPLRPRARVVRNPIAGPLSPEPPRTRIDGALRVAYVGRVSGRKGVDVVVEAVAMLRARGVPAELDIVGDIFPGYEWYLAELHHLVDSRGLHDVVRFHGYQPDVWGFIGASDVVVVPSRLEEGFGNTAVEALLGGRPVVVSDTSGLREASAGFGGAHRVPPGDVAALAAALSEIVDAWPDVRVAAVADQRPARERHAPAAYRAGIVEVVTSVLCGAGRRTGSVPSATPSRSSEATDPTAHRVA